MTDSPAANAAIDKLLQEYQAMGDAEKQQAPLREAAEQKLDQLIDSLANLDQLDANSLSDEMAAAFVIFQQLNFQKAQAGDPSAHMALSRFDDNFMNAFDTFMQGVQADPAKLQGIQVAVQDLAKDLQPPQLPSNETLFAVAVDEPEEGFGEWTMAFIAMKIDEDYNVSLAETLERDVDVTFEISPAKSLSDEFNVPGKRYKAGQEFEPFVVTHETEEGDMSSQLQVRGHVFENGQRVGEIQMPTLPMYKQQAMSMDIEELMRMIGQDNEGPSGPPNSNGPNGPN